MGCFTSQGDGPGRDGRGSAGLWVEWPTGHTDSTTTGGSVTVNGYSDCPNEGCDGAMREGTDAEGCPRCEFERLNRDLLAAFGVPWPEGGIRYATVILRPECAPCIEVYASVPPFGSRRFRVVDIGDGRPAGRPHADNPLGGYDQQRLLNP